MTLIKKLVFIPCFIFCVNLSHAQVPVLKWVQGDSVNNKVPSTFQSFVGARNNAAAWLDSADNIIIYGGEGNSTNGRLGILNDLWKYDQQTQIWEILNGDTDVNSTPELDNALQFDGIDDYVVLNNLIPFAEDCTFEIVFKVKDSNSNRSIFGLNEQNGCCYLEQPITFGLQYDRNDLQFVIGDLSRPYLAFTGLESEQWLKFTMTIEKNADGLNEEIKFFINGQFQNAFLNDFDQKIDATDTSYLATVLGTGLSQQLEGAISELTIWNTVRTEEQIINDFSNKIRGNEEGLLAHYSFNQGIRNGDNSTIQPNTFEPQTFSRPDFVADYTLPQFQWRLSPTVALVRESIILPGSTEIYTSSLHNLQESTRWSNTESPLFAVGYTADVNPEDYVQFRELYYQFTPYTDMELNTPISVYLPVEGRYFDAVFTQYTLSRQLDPESNGGGGFAVDYIEVTPPNPINQVLDGSSNNYHAEMKNFEKRSEGYFKGEIADYRVWSVARSEADIQANLLAVDPESLGLEVYYDFEDGIAGGDNSSLSTVLDKSSNAYNGNLLGFSLTELESNFVETTLPAATETTNALKFDGLGDYLDIPNLNVYSGNFTVEGWFKAEEDGTLFSWSPAGTESNLTEGAIVAFISNNRLTFSIPFFTIFASFSYAPLAEWFHFAVTVEKDASGTNEKISYYINGLFQYAELVDLDPVINDGSGDFISKVGYNTSNYPSLVVSTGGGLVPEAKSNWVAGPREFSILSRTQAVHFTDQQNNFWVYGGLGNDNNSRQVYFNDLRKLNTANNEWELINGTNNSDRLPTYGDLAVFDENSHPGARGSAASWFINDSLFVFGGNRYSADSAKILNDLWLYDISDEQWTWIGGSDQINQTSTRGNLNQAGQLFDPGARTDASAISDMEGNLWLFGGANQNELFNDLWKYSVASQEWTWVSGSAEGNQPGIYGTMGVADVANSPGARTGGQMWFKDNKIWLFGGFGYDVNGQIQNEMNDFWSFDLQTLQWTWVGGPNFSGNTGDYGFLGVPAASNIPGARQNANTFINSAGELVMFGGYKYTQFKSGNYNDLWKYNIEQQTWVWTQGINQTTDNDFGGQVGAFEGGSILYPGGRDGSASWVDSNGDFWIYGGRTSEVVNNGLLNDLWKYDRINNKWDYIGGSIRAEHATGSYGTLGLGTANNVPRNRWNSSYWYGDDGKLWFFGGVGTTSVGGNITWLNDLWSFDPRTKIYTWESGSNTAGAEGSFGVKGVPSITNVPGPRSSAAHWKDKEGNFWLFGGYENFEFSNDLWKYNPNTKEWTWISGRNSQNIPGNYGVQGIASPSNEISSRRYMSGWEDKEGNFWIFGGEGVDVNSEFGQLNDLWKFDVKSSQWIWINGSKTLEAEGNYGVLGVPSPDNQPPARSIYASWTDEVGNFWILGGRINNDFMNDLWRFDVRTEEWTWFGGRFFPRDEIINIDNFARRNYNLSQFGSIGIGSASNSIGPRQAPISYNGGQNDLWLYGGGLGGTVFNDFWQLKFIPGEVYLYPTDTITETSFTISYDEAWAINYNIQIAEEQNFSQIKQTLNTTQRQSVITGLNSATKYYFRINALNDLGESGFVATDSILTLPIPPILNRVEITDITPHQALLSWQASAGIIDQYQIEISLDSTFQNRSRLVAGFEEKIVDFTSTNISVNNLVPGTVYYVRMKAINTTGKSRYGEVLSFVTKPEKPIIDQVLSKNSAQQFTFDLKWNSISGQFDTYYVYVATDSLFTSPDSLFNGLPIEKSLNTLAITNRNAGSYYYVYMVSENISGRSVNSDTLRVLTKPETPIFPAATFLSNVTKTSAVVSWNAVPEIINAYELEVAIDNSFNPNFLLEDYGKSGQAKLIDKSLTTDTLQNLEPGLSYYIRVRALNPAGKSPNSNVVFAKTIPNAPSISAINNISQNSASISWSSPLGAGSYLIDVNTSADFGADSFIFENFPVAVPFQILSDLEEGQNYYVRIQSSNENGSSGLISPPDYADTSFITVPATPFISTLNEVTQSTAILSWDEITGAEFYQLDLSNNGFQTFFGGYNNVQIEGNQIELVNLNAGESYQARLTAMNVSGTSPFSQVFNLTTVPPTPIARDASTVAATTFTANWDPVTSATYYILEVSDDNFLTFTEDTYPNPVPVRINNLIEGTTYKYRVKAGNNSGISPASNEVEVTVASNAQSLSILNVDFNPAFNRSADNSSITIQLGGGQGNVQASIKYKGVLSTIWEDSVQLNPVQANTYSFMVQAEMLDEVGLDFEISVSDGITNLIRTNRINWIFDNSQSDAIPFFDLSGEWQMFSIPYVLNDNLIETIFSQLTQLNYKFDWRLVHYNGNEYVDAGAGINRIDLGKGYWFNNKNGGNLTIRTGGGSVNISSPFNMVLNEGWNQIGNPFNIPISWNDVRRSNGAIATIDPIITYDATTKVFNETDVLPPFSAGFVWADESRDLAVSMTSSSSGLRIAEDDNEDFSNQIDAASWELPIILNSAIADMEIAKVGMHPLANLSKDQFDKMTVPRFFNFTEMSSYHEDYFYPYFSSDIRPTSNKESWLFTLNSNIVSGNITLSWDNSEFKFAKKQLWLIDEENSKMINMNSTKAVTFNLKEDHKLSFHLTADDQTIPLPYLFQIGNPYPNPTNRMSRVNISLPESAQALDIKFTLHDIQGRQLKVLAKGSYGPGLYEFETDFDEFKSLESGLFLYRLEVSGPMGQTIFKKMILKK